MEQIENGMLTPWPQDHYETEAVPVRECEICGHDIYLYETYYDDDVRIYCCLCWEEHVEQCQKIA